MKLKIVKKLLWCFICDEKNKKIAQKFLPIREQIRAKSLKFNQEKAVLRHFLVDGRNFLSTNKNRYYEKGTNSSRTRFVITNRDSF